MAERKTPDQLIAQVEELPTLPSIVYELNAVIQDPLSSAGDVENIMTNDQAMTTRVLKLANSAYYAVPGGVSSLGRAIAYLGFDTVQQLVLGAAVMDAVKTDNTAGGMDAGKFWQHSMGVAMAAEAIAKFMKHASHADIFTCGLLHDLGKMALMNIDAELLAKISENAIEKKLSMHESEMDLSEVRHTQIGHALAKKWKLPLKIQNIALHHHDFEMSKRAAVSAEVNEIIDIVMLANLLIHALKFGNSGHAKIVGAPKSLLERVQISPDQVKKVVIEIRKALTNADAFLSIIGGDA